MKGKIQTINRIGYFYSVLSILGGSILGYISLGFFGLGLGLIGGVFLNYLIKKGIQNIKLKQMEMEEELK